MRPQRYRAGELTEKITLRKIMKEDDGGGGFIRTSVDYATTRAKIIPRYGSEQVNNERVETLAGYTVIIYTRPDVDELTHVYWHQQNRLLEITFVMRTAARNLFTVIETNMGRPV